MKKETPKSLLKNLWGYDSFLPPQEEIINEVLNNNDVLALLPTGGGKSICYQLPALLQEGICIVISPLMALIKDQIAKLHQVGIKAVFLSSEQLLLLQSDVIEYVINENCKILYVSPERLTNYSFTRMISQLDITLIAVDEAHCISEWGNDFRPSYLNIKQFREDLKNPTTIALTATATPIIQKDIVEKLGIKKAVVYKNSFKRENLSLNIIKTENKVSQIVYLSKKHPGSSIIYVRTRKETEELHQTLQQKGLNVAYYHAGLSEREKNLKQQAWLQSNNQMLISTNAFGMGIDKDDVPLIIHYSPSYSLENYYQEVGRAGRNNEAAFAHLFYNDFDLSTMKSEISSATPTPAEYKHIVKRFYSHFQITEGELVEEVLSLEIKTFCKNHKIGFRKAITVLQYLNNSGVISWQSNISKSSIQILLSPFEVDDLKGFDAKILETLARDMEGIFTQLIKFNESKLAKYLNINPQDLKSYLNNWKEKGYIIYQDGTLHQIQMITERNDYYIIHTLGNKFFKYQKQKWKKYSEMEFFLENKKYCRMKLIVGYFGEKLKENCGICDVCLHTEEISNASLPEKIINFVSEKPKTIHQIMLEFTNYPQTDILEIIQDLISESKIKNLTFNTYIKCPN